MLRNFRKTLQFPKWVWAVARDASLVSVIVFLAAICIPNEYTSEARILPKSVGGSSLINSLMNAASVLGVGAGQGDDGASYVDIINSRLIAEAALKREFSYGDRWFFFKSFQPRKGSLSEYLKEENLDKAVDLFQRRLLSVDRDLKSGLITVRVKTRSPELSRSIIKTVLEDAESFLQRLSMGQGRSRERYSASRLVEAQIAARQSELALTRFASTHRNYHTSGDPAVRLTGARLEMDLSTRQQIVVALSMAQGQAQLEATNDIPILNLLDGGNLPSNKSGPRRGLWAISGFLIGGFFSISMRNRERITAYLLSS